ncbi:hypothetical protein BLNAU_21539 [Blattamonas nauphoetae]|uniref:Uncharacterized protein n=1 Tax=Blattamonas nauphoetae TaxID=2049346 RepID=A0ABQ9WVM8_9EUKA|nr:hypothetical protein BLNAU_21539 [Blattamonas nauphoetae]
MIYSLPSTVIRDGDPFSDPLNTRYGLATTIKFSDTECIRTPLILHDRINEFVKTRPEASFLLVDNGLFHLENSSISFIELTLKTTASIAYVKNSSFVMDGGDIFPSLSEPFTLLNGELILSEVRFHSVTHRIPKLVSDDSSSCTIVLSSMEISHVSLISSSSLISALKSESTIAVSLFLNVSSLTSHKRPLSGNGSSIRVEGSEFVGTQDEITGTISSRADRTSEFSVRNTTFTSSTHENEVFTDAQVVTDLSSSFMNCRFVDCSSEADGGSLSYVPDIQGEVTQVLLKLTKCTFSKGHSKGNGGHLFVSAPLTSTARLFVSESDFRDGMADGAGGGMHVLIQFCFFTLVNVSNCSSHLGGSILAFSSLSVDFQQLRLLISEILWDNGRLVVLTNEITISYSIFELDVPHSDGALIVDGQDSSLTIVRSSFLNTHPNPTIPFIFWRMNSGRLNSIREVLFHMPASTCNGWCFTTPNLDSEMMSSHFEKTFALTSRPTHSPILAKDDVAIFLPMEISRYEISPMGTDAVYCGISIPCRTFDFIRKNRQLFSSYSVHIARAMTLPTPIITSPHLSLISAGVSIKISGEGSPFFIHNERFLEISGGTYRLTRAQQNGFVQMIRGEVKLNCLFLFRIDEGFASESRQFALGFGRNGMHSSLDRQSSELALCDSSSAPLSIDSSIGSGLISSFGSEIGDSASVSMSVSNQTIVHPLIDLHIKNRFSLTASEFKDITSGTPSMSLISIHAATLFFDECSFTKIDLCSTVISFRTISLTLGTIRNCQFVDCSSRMNGGILDLSLGSIRISDCLFRRCVGVDFGAILVNFIEGGLFGLNCTDTLFDDNSCSSKVGCDIHYSDPLPRFPNVKGSRSSSRWPRITHGKDFKDNELFDFDRVTLIVSYVGADTRTCGSSNSPCQSIAFALGIIPQHLDSVTISLDGYLGPTSCSLLHQKVQMIGARRTVLEVDQKDAFSLKHSTLEVNFIQFDLFRSISRLSCFTLFNSTANLLNCQFASPGWDSFTCIVKADSSSHLSMRYSSLSLNSVRTAQTFLELARTSAVIVSLAVNLVHMDSSCHLYSFSSLSNKQIYLDSLSLSLNVNGNEFSLVKCDMSEGGWFKMNNCTFLLTNVISPICLISLQFGNSNNLPPHSIVFTQIKFDFAEYECPINHFLLLHLPSEPVGLNITLDRWTLSSADWDSLSYTTPTSDTPTSLVPVLFEHSNEFFVNESGTDFLFCGDSENACKTIDYIQNTIKTRSKEFCFIKMDTGHTLLSPICNTHHTVTVSSPDHQTLSVTGKLLSTWKMGIKCTSVMVLSSLNIFVPLAKTPPSVIIVCDSGNLSLTSVSFLSDLNRIQWPLVVAESSVVKLWSVSTPPSDPHGNSGGQSSAMFLLSNSSVTADFFESNRLSFSKASFLSLLRIEKCEGATMRNVTLENVDFDGRELLCVSESSVRLETCEFSKLKLNSSILVFVGSSREHRLVVEDVTIRTVTQQHSSLFTIFAASSEIVVSRFKISEVLIVAPQQTQMENQTPLSDHSLVEQPFSPHTSFVSDCSSNHEMALSRSLDGRRGSVFGIDLGKEGSLVMKGIRLEDIESSIGNSEGTIFIAQSCSMSKATLWNITFMECRAAQHAHLVLSFPSLERFSLTRTISQIHPLNRQKSVLILGEEKRVEPIVDFVTFRPVEFVLLALACVVGVCVVFSLVLFLPSFWWLLWCRSYRSRTTLSSRMKCCGCLQPEHGTVDGMEFGREGAVNADIDRWLGEGGYEKLKAIGIIWMPQETVQGTEGRRVEGGMGSVGDGERDGGRDRVGAEWKRTKRSQKEKRKRRVDDLETEKSETDTDSERFLLDSSSSEEL